MQEININIVGSCVLRDCFVIGESSEIQHDIKITKFIQNIYPLNLYSNKIQELQSIKSEDLIFGSPWERKMLLQGIKKDTFNENFSSDYLMIDMCQMGHPLVYYKQVVDSYLLNSVSYRKNKSILENKFQISEPFQAISPWVLSTRYIEKCLDKFVDDILKRYEPHRIILVNVYNVNECLNTQKNVLEKFSINQNVDTKNQFINMASQYVKNKLKDCHIVEFPKYVFAVDNHKWGKAPLHYSKECYEYLHKAIDTICFDYPREEEIEILNKLKYDCERQYLNLREKIK